MLGALPPGVTITDGMEGEVASTRFKIMIPDPTQPKKEDADSAMAPPILLCFDEHAAGRDGVMGGRIRLVIPSVEGEMLPPGVFNLILILILILKVRCCLPVE